MPLTLDEIQSKLSTMAQNPPIVVERVPDDLSSLTFEELKAKELIATDWLKTHTHDRLYGIGKLRHDRLVKALNARAQRLLDEEKVVA